MKLSKVLTPSLLTVILLLPLQLSWAQIEVSQQRTSLQGITKFYVAVNVEGNKNLTDEEPLDVTQLQKEVQQKLKNANAQILDQDEVSPGEEYPYLYMHINTKDAGRGIIPFAINIKFYQPVKLTLNRNMPYLASTWDTGNVGVVSHDQIPFIKEAAMALIDEFVRDYKTANSNQ